MHLIMAWGVPLQQYMHSGQIYLIYTLNINGHK